MTVDIFGRFGEEDVLLGSLDLREFDGDMGGVVLRLGGVFDDIDESVVDVTHLTPGHDGEQYGDAAEESYHTQQLGAHTLCE